MHCAVDYYREHWPEERWQEDARLMREAGFGADLAGPFSNPNTWPMICAWGYGIARASKQGAPFWVMEQQAGPAGQRVFSPTPRPNQLRLWTYQAVAHGARAITYFRWRSCLFGAEQFWHGILDHDGLPRRCYHEIKSTVRELSDLGDDLAEARTNADVALLFSYDASWALGIQPCHPELSYRVQSIRYNAPCYFANIAVDIVDPDADLSPYKIIVAPDLYVVDTDLARRLAEYVHQGGLLILGFRSGVKDADNQVYPVALPGLLADLFGVVVAEYDVLYDQPQGLHFSLPGLEGLEGLEATCQIWADILESTTAETLAVYTSDYYAQAPAITRNRQGRGQAIYVGTDLDDDGLRRLLLALADDRGIGPLLATPTGIEATRRNTAQQQWWFILNHTSEAKLVHLPRALIDAFSQRVVMGDIELPG